SGVELPVILGHETAGHVVAAGPGVDGYAEGVPVAMAPVIPCLRFFACRHDLENICEDGRIMGYAPDGGMAQYMLVPADAVAAGCLFVARADLPAEQLPLAEPPGGAPRPGRRRPPSRWRQSSRASAGRASSRTTSWSSSAPARSASCMSSS